MNADSYAADDFAPRNEYFREAIVLVRPLKTEIDAGILIPGHRFIPFYDPALVPGDLVIVEEQSHTPIERRTVTRAQKDLLQFYTLFGQDSMAHLLLIEDEANIQSLQSGEDPENTLFRVSVFDLSEFYRLHEFSEDDLIECRLLNYEQGNFAYRYVSAEEASQYDEETWFEALDRGFEQSFQSTKYPIDPVEQVVYAFFFAGREAVTQPATNLGSYVVRSETVDFFPYGGRVYLWRCGAEPDDIDMLSDKEPAFTGAAGNLDEIFEDCGIAFSESDVIAIMLDALDSESGIEEVLQTVVPQRTDAFVNIDQATAFAGFCSELWDRLAAHPEEHGSDTARALRHALVQILLTHVHWLRSLDFRGIETSELPVETMMQMMNLSAMVSDALRLLNDSEEDATDELSNLEESADQIGEALEAMIEEVEADLQTRLGHTLAVHKTNYLEVAADAVYQLKIQIEHIRPPIWRRIRIPGNCTLADLHEVIQIVFGWGSTHLHDFRIDGNTYSDPTSLFDGFAEEIDENSVTLQDLYLEEKQKFRYCYDFGDDWMHAIRVEKIDSSDEVDPEELRQVRCLRGKRATPPEDCGGHPGYMRLVDLLDGTADEPTEYDKEFLEYYGNFDPDYFDLDAINGRLDAEDD